MATKLKKLEDQVIVITGASSGIGLATAETAAKRGAKLVLAARSDRTLDELAERIQDMGGEALAIPCDVTVRTEVEEVARAAIDRFGRIDTWVNNAGLGMYGRLDEVSDEDSRRLFDINFWGVVYGSLVALPHLKENGGALINVGSEVSEAVVPLLGMYSSSKHAVKGFTDTLRLEIEDVDQAPVCITLIQPSAVDTPFPQHARNYMELEPKLPDPMIDPQQVADAILHAATKPTRNKKVGTMAVVDTWVSKLFPNVADKFSVKRGKQQHYDEPPRHSDGILRDSSEKAPPVGQTRGTGGRENKSLPSRRR